MLSIGITGPTGSGKTTVLDVIADLGGYVIDCDAVYHQLTESCKDMLDELLAAFGAGVFDDAGRLDRRALAAVVFDDPCALADLSSITHKYVAAEVERRLAQAEREGYACAAIDAIALIESGLAERCDVTVAVIAPEAVRAERIMARDGISREAAQARIAAQRPAGWFARSCAYTISNDGMDPSAFYGQAKGFFEKIMIKKGA